MTFVLKVAEGIYQHVDVREEGKENAFSLGHTLWINNEVSGFPSCLVFLRALRSNPTSMLFWLLRVPQESHEFSAGV